MCDHCQTDGDVFQLIYELKYIFKDIGLIIGRGFI